MGERQTHTMAAWLF